MPEGFTARASASAEISELRPVTTLRDVSALLQLRPAALITDIDGTISSIVPRPEEARVSDAVRASLQALSRSMDLVAVVTGRDRATARSLVGAEGITYVGNYGLDSEGFEAGLIRGALAEAHAVADALPCIQLEDKGVSFALHYRNCDEPDVVRGRIVRDLVPVAARYGARIIEGKMVVELVPGSLPDKASAVLRLVERNSIEAVVYFGDDLGDIPVFEFIRARRMESGRPGLAVAVVDSETDSSVIHAADAVLNSTAALEELLVQLSGTFQGR